mmetsp:Transcript_23048/g.91398  ORF Transcript_23048/g.91398 Transcript_23048/m.91398 type:complete len:391 (+) Transcript_23048:381-1553(+)
MVKRGVFSLCGRGARAAKDDDSCSPQQRRPSRSLRSCGGGNVVGGTRGGGFPRRNTDDDLRRSRRRGDDAQARGLRRTRSSSSHGRRRRLVGRARRRGGGLGDRAVDDVEEALGERGLGFVVVHADAAAERSLLGQRVRGERAEHLVVRPAHLGFPLAQRLRAAVPVHDGHLDVEEHKVVEPVLHLSEGLPAVLARVDGVAARLEDALHEPPHGARVVNHEDAPQRLFPGHRVRRGEPRRRPFIGVPRPRRSPGRNAVCLGRSARSSRSPLRMMMMMIFGVGPRRRPRPPSAALCFFLAERRGDGVEIARLEDGRERGRAFLDRRAVLPGERAPTVRRETARRRRHRRRVRRILVANVVVAAGRDEPAALVVVLRRRRFGPRAGPPEPEA